MPSVELKKCLQSPLFQEAYSELLSSIKSNSAIEQPLSCAGLLGSAAAGEAVEGYSDLDVLLVLDSDEQGGIEQEVIRKLKALVEPIQSRYLNNRISLLTHSWDDFENYVNFEYLRHYSHTQPGFERNKGEFASRMKELHKKAGSTKHDVVARYCVNQLRMYRFNVNRKCASPNEQRVLAKYLIDSLFEVLDFASISEGNWADSKRSLISQTESLYPKVYSVAARIAYNVRANWAESVPRDYEQIIEELPKLIENLTAAVIQKYPGEARPK